MILLAICIISTCLVFLGSWRILRHWTADLNPSTGADFDHDRSTKPIISILKPINGLDLHLEQNLHSFFALSGSVPYEIIFCFQDLYDPAIGLVEHLKVKFPNVTARIVVSTNEIGKNPKVNNLSNGWYHAQSDLILISDANVRVEADYLEKLLVCYRDERSLVTQAVWGIGGKTIGSQLDAVHLNSFYLKATAVIEILGHVTVLGKCMLFSKTEFERIGGLGCARNHLAEDLVISERMKQNGWNMQLQRSLLRYTSGLQTFGEYWNRHVRWARLRKCHFLPAYFLETLLFETVWPLALLVYAQVSTEDRELYSAVAVTCLLLQWTSNLILHIVNGQGSATFKSFSYFLVKDFIAPFVWLGGLCSNKVIWRGNVLHLKFGGRLFSRSALRPKWNVSSGLPGVKSLPSNR